MRVKLQGDRVLVRLDKPVTEKEVEGTTIVYPEGSHGDSGELQVWGEVLQVGPGKWATKKGQPTGRRIPIDLEPGDRVMLTWYLSQVETNKALAAIIGEDQVIIRPEDVLCVEPKASAGQPSA